MDPSMVPKYEQCYSTNSIVACFGSGERCTDDDRQDIHQAIKAYKRFINGDGLVLSGGGPNMMEAFIQSARDVGLYTGAILLQRPGYSLAEADILFPFSDGDLNERQKSLVDSASACFVFEGGVGTQYEFWEALVKQKVERLDKPVLVIGSKGYLDAVRGLLGNLVSKEMVPDYVVSQVHFIDRAEGVEDDVYHMLLSHYGFGPT
jgi:predicted Rossmann-fold nucleotide-binding protein